MFTLTVPLRQVSGRSTGDVTGAVRPGTRAYDARLDFLGPWGALVARSDTLILHTPFRWAFGAATMRSPGCGGSRPLR
ncbi:hypothetical protein, partial [Streptomyces anatolicus]|uniref:hypothetical protein n=1 Tax=Streptomyces anatolicus TaxID=2675858 RepID=UPI001CA4ABC9